MDNNINKSPWKIHLRGLLAKKISNETDTTVEDAISLLNTISDKEISTAIMKYSKYGIEGIESMTMKTEGE